MTPEEDSFSNPHRRKVAAWPIILVGQLIALGTLGALWWWTTPPAPPPLSQRLLDLPTDQTDAALIGAIHDIDDGRALTEGAQRQANSFLSLLAQASEMKAGAVDFRPGVPHNGVQPVDAHFSLTGDPYHLPIVLNGLSRQRAINHPLSVRGTAGKPHQFKLIVRYYRPAPADTDWIAGKLEKQAPNAISTTPLLEKAATLTRWRQFQQYTPQLSARAQRAQQEAAQILPVQLIQLAEKGQNLQWRLEAPLRLTGQPLTGQ